MLSRNAKIVKISEDLTKLQRV